MNLRRSMGSFRPSIFIRSLIDNVENIILLKAAQIVPVSIGVWKLHVDNTQAHWLLHICDAELMLLPLLSRPHLMKAEPLLKY